MWKVWVMSYTVQNSWTYPLRIEHAGIKPLTSQNLCTYPTGIQHASIKEEVNIEMKNRGHLEVRDLLEQVEMEMEDKYHPEKFEARVPDEHHIYVSFLACKSTFVWLFELIRAHLFVFSFK